jgi:hypothetical protein
MTDEERSKLIKLAGEMVLCRNMPPHCIGDWDMPAPKSRKACRAITEVSEAAHNQCKSWSKRIMEIVDAKRQCPDCGGVEFETFNSDLDKCVGCKTLVNCE